MTNIFLESDWKEINESINSYRNWWYEPTTEELEKEAEYYYNLIWETLDKK